MPPLDINYLAVLVAAVAIFILGALWYSPLLFARAWMSAHEYTPENLEQMKQGMGKAYALSFLSYLIMATVMGALVSWTGANTVWDGLRLGLYIWCGFALTIGLTSWLFSDRRFATFAIDAGYQLVSIVMTGILLSVWR